MNRIVWLVFRREALETLRDRRTLLVMVLFPLVVYPALALLLTQVTADRAGKLQAQRSRVAVVGGEPSRSELLRIIEHDPGAEGLPFAVSTAERDEAAAVAALRAGRVDAVARVGPRGAQPGGATPVTLLYDSTRDASLKARERLEDTVGRALPPGCAFRYATAITDLAPRIERGGHMLAKALPAVLVVMVMLGALYPAIDTTAGERERGTLETTLVAPVRRTDLLLGKVLAVALLAALTGAANLGSLAFTFVQAVRMAGAPADVPLPWSRVLLAGTVALPTAALFAALMVTVAATARSFKEAQNLLTPVYFLFMAPALVASVAEPPLGYALALVPGLNLALLARAVLVGHTPLGPAMLTLASVVVVIALCLRVAARLYDSERLLTVSEAGPAPGRDDTSSRPARPANAGDAFALFAIGFVILVLFLPLQQRALVPGLLLSEWIGMLGLVLAYARWSHRSPRDVLALRRPPARALIGAALVGGSAWVSAGLLAQWVLPAPPALVEEMKRTLADGGRPLLGNLLLVALTPAVCEEALFRGPILRGLLPRFGTTGAVLLSAAMFSLFHLNLYRLLPTAILGVLLGYIAARSGSLWPSMLAHLLNNGLLITLAGLDKDEVLERLPWAWQAGAVGIGVVITALGLRLVAGAHPPRDAQAVR